MNARQRETAEALRKALLVVEAGVDKPSRYLAAMVANARGILDRMEAAPDSDALLLDHCGGERDLTSLARRLRAGEISEKTMPGLRRVLFDHLAAELEVTNPAYLERQRSRRC